MMSIASLKKSLGFSFLDKYIGYILRFVSTLIIARLLSPDEIGIFSVAFTFISLAHVFRDFGAAQYLIREKNLDEGKLSTIFISMLVISWSIFLLLYYSRFLIASFYGRSEIEDCLLVLSFIFLLAPFGTVRLGLLRREMDFKTLAKINIFSYLTLNGVTIILACWGIGYLSLVWGQLAGVIATLIAACFYKRLPAFKLKFNHIGHIFKFGLKIGAINFLEIIIQGAPELILGKTFGMSGVGFFGRAQGIIMLFKTALHSSIVPVLLPFFSNRLRDGKLLFEDYKIVLSCYTALALPFLAVLSVSSSLIIQVLFGAVWLPASPIVVYLCLGAFAEALLPFVGPYLVAQGQESMNLKLQVVQLILVVLCLALGCFFSLEIAAVSYSISQWGYFLITLFVFHRAGYIYIKDWFVAVYKNLILSLLLIFFSKVIFVLSSDNLYLELLLLCSLTFIIWLFFILLSQHPIKNFLFNKHVSLERGT